MASTQKVEAAQYLLRRGSKHVYVRRVPKWLQGALGTKTWWITVSDEIGIARREAAALTDFHNRMVSPATRHLLEQAGGPETVRNAMRVYVMESAYLTHQPQTWRRDMMPDPATATPDDLREAVLDLQHAEATVQRVRAESERLRPLLHTMPLFIGRLPTKICEPDTITVAMAAQRCLSDPKRIRKANSRDKWGITLRRFAEVCGDPPLSSVTRAMMDQFIDEITQLPRHAGLPHKLRSAPVSTLITWRREHPKHPPVLPHTVKSHLNVMRAMFSWCIKRDWMTSNPTSHIEAPDDPRGADPSHHPSMPWQAVPTFMRKLLAYNSDAARALAFTILTGARSEEVLRATWVEIDLEELTWTIPANRMKGKREHVVPLSNGAVHVLLDAKRQGRGGATVFGTLSEKAMRTLIRDKMEVRNATPHGFRSSLRTFAAEATDHDPQISSMALAHTVGDAVMRAYQRSNLLEKRRVLMEDWGRHCMRAFT